MTRVLLACASVLVAFIGRWNRDAVYDVQHYCLKALGED